MKKRAFLFLLTFLFIFIFAGCDFFRGADDPTTNTDDPTLTTTITTQKTDTTTRTATETTNPDTTDVPQEIDIIFRDWDGTLLHQETVIYGFNATGIAPTPPGRPNYLLYTYTFIGWDDQIINITYTKTVYAVYSRDYVSVSNYNANAIGNLVQNLTGIPNPVTRQEIIDYMLENYNTVSEHELFDVLNIAKSIKVGIEAADPELAILEEIEAFHEYFYHNENGDIGMLANKLLEFMGYLYEIGDPYLCNMLVEYQNELELAPLLYEGVAQDLTYRQQAATALCELSENENGECQEWWDYHTQTVEYERDYEDAFAAADFNVLDYEQYGNLISAFEDYVYALYISLENVESYLETYTGLYNEFSAEEKVIIDVLIPIYELYQMNYNFTQVLSYPDLETEMIDGKSVMQHLNELFFGYTDEDENYHPGYQVLYDSLIDTAQRFDFLNYYVPELLFNYNNIELISYYLDKAES
jgi:hypothetical protein